MNTDVAYMLSVKNLSKILDAIQKAGAPDSFNHDFLKDLGFTSSNDRGVIKVLKYLGFIDGSGKPQNAYKSFMDHTKAKKVLANRLMAVYDDLYLSDKSAHTKTVTVLKGWFKTKTGAGDSVAEKMARTFKTFADYADFTGASLEPQVEAAPTVPTGAPSSAPEGEQKTVRERLGLVYRIEIHLPDTQNVDTFRAIFRALREELLP